GLSAGGGGGAPAGAVPEQHGGGGPGRAVPPAARPADPAHRHPVPPRRRRRRAGLRPGRGGRAQAPGRHGHRARAGRPAAVRLGQPGPRRAGHRPHRGRRARAGLPGHGREERLQQRAQRVRGGRRADPHRPLPHGARRLRRDALARGPLGGGRPARLPAQLRRLHAVRRGRGAARHRVRPARPARVRVHRRLPALERGHAGRGRVAAPARGRAHLLRDGRGGAQGRLPRCRHRGAGRHPAPVGDRLGRLRGRRRAPGVAALPAGLRRPGRGAAGQARRHRRRARQRRLGQPAAAARHRPGAGPLRARRPRRARRAGRRGVPRPRGGGAV
ncbi:MAG: 3-oxoacyl-[acyl-carrier-protein] synthase, KASIII, partial [uncultured Pseudonocardia sp.]